MSRKKALILTDHELRLMEVLWRLGRATVADVVDLLPPPPLAYSTVLTTLRTLEQKGYITHQEDGRAYVYHAVSTVEALQRRKGVRVELAVVVVLDDVRAHIAGPRQQFSAPKERHRAAERKLMRGRNVCKCGLWRQLTRPHAQVIDPNAMQNETVSREYRARKLIARILDRYVLAAAHQGESDEVEGRLGAFDNDDLIGLGDDAAELRDVTRDRLTQFHQAGGLAVI